MLYYLIADISSVSEDEVSALRDKIACHFSDKSSLKRKDSVCCKAVLCYLLKEKYALNEFVVECEQNGKPFIVGSDICFNLSHSADKVLCVCGEGRTGCDIELVREHNEKVTHRYFCSEEQMLLENSEHRNADFTKLWTLKESILKLSGVGMSGGLSTHNFSEFLTSGSFDYCGLHFESFTDEGYSVSICSEKKGILQLRADIKDIINNLKGENHEFNQVH